MTIQVRHVADVENLAREWNQAKNEPFNISEVRLGSSKAFWWTCPIGHEYLAVVNNRAKGSGCSVCSGKKILEGFNDLSTTAPDLASEISNLNKDSDLKFKISSGSNKKIWWRCDEGHDWEASPNNRRNGRSGCPVCSNRKIVKGQNDLATVRPYLALEFAGDLNSALTANEVASNSNKSYWWRCAKGHTWKNTLGNRVKGQGCPFCSGRQAIRGESDLATTNPKLASEWHKSLNETLSPSQIKEGSGLKVWWLCPEGHTYRSKVSDRSKGNGCAVCAGLILVTGINDLKTLRPDLAREVVKDGNTPQDPSKILSGGKSKVLWRCKLGHEWNASVAKRLAGQGCPYCGNKRVLINFNDLATTHPKLAKEFDLEKNYPLTPKDLLAGTNGIYWWKCKFGHSWKTSGSHRVLGRDCPTCAVTGYNPSNPGLIYFIENESLGAKKVGITNVGAKTDRLKAFKAAGWKILATYISDDGQIISDIETQILRWIRKDLHFPPFLDSTSMATTGGASETFSGEVNSEVVIAKIIKLLIENKVHYR
jgi:hypothetical protein